MHTSSTARHVLLTVALAAVAACADDRRDRTAPTAPATAVTDADAIALRPANVPRARAQIEAILAALDAAWNAGDAAAYAAPFADDVQLITPTGGAIGSRAGVQQLHQFLFGGPLAGSDRTTTSATITFLTGTIAVVDRVGDVTNFAFAPPGTVQVVPGTIRARERQVYVKDRGAWRIAFAQLTNVPPAP